MTQTKTLGIIGYGNIGYEIAKRVKGGLGMKVLAWKRNVQGISEEYGKWIDEAVSAD